MVIKSKTKYKCVVCHTRMNKIFIYKYFSYYKCPNCKLVSTFPIPRNSDLYKHYKNNFLAGNYELLNKYSNDYSIVYKNFRNTINKYIKRFGRGKYKKLLDVGCFTGGFMEVMKKENYDVYGIELQQEAAQIANITFKGKVKTGDVTDKIGFKTNFDIICMNGLIEHVKDPLYVIKSYSKILRKYGILFIETPDSASLLARLLSKYWPPYEPIEHIHIFSRKSIRLVLTKLGYKNIYIYRHIKYLPIRYVYNNFNNFGIEFYRIFNKLDSYLNKINTRLPFYIGEIKIVAIKNNNILNT